MENTYNHYSLIHCNPCNGPVITGSGVIAEAASIAVVYLAYKSMQENTESEQTQKDQKETLVSRHQKSHSNEKKSERYIKRQIVVCAVSTAR